MYHELDLLCQMVKIWKPVEFIKHEPLQLLVDRALHVPIGCLAKKSLHGGLEDLNAVEQIF